MLSSWLSACAVLLYSVLIVCSFFRLVSWTGCGVRACHLLINVVYLLSKLSQSRMVMGMFRLVSDDYKYHNICVLSYRTRFILVGNSAKLTFDNSKEAIQLGVSQDALIRFISVSLLY